MSSIRKSKILIVDDNELVVKSLIPVLTDEGYEVHYAFTGEAALAKALKSRFSLILLDIKLPDIDGFQVLDRLKKTAFTANTPVIFISSSDDDSIYQRGFRMGVMDYLKKPVSRAELLFRIKNYLRLGRTEEQLRHSETFFKSIVEDQTEFVVRYTCDGKVIFANSSFCRYLGTTEEKIAGKNFYRLLNLGKESSLRLVDNDPELPVKTDTVSIKSPDKKIVWQQWTRRIITDETNNKTFIQAVGRDITDVKKKEDGLRIWEKIFRDAQWGIVASIPDDPRLILMNEAYARMHGFTIDELIGMDVRELLPYRTDRFVSDVFSIVRKKGSYSYQSLHRKKNGDEFTAMSQASMVHDEFGKELLMVVHVHDITESLNTTNALKESEEKFRTVFINTPDLIAIIKTKDFTIVDVNDNFLNTYGFTKEEVLNKPGFVEQFFPNPQEIKKQMRMMGRTGTITNAEIELKAKNGDNYHALVSVSRIRLNKLSHAVVIVRNIEELKKYQESLQKSETKFRMLADYNYIWEFWIGPDNRFIYISPSCESITGFNVDEFMENLDTMMDQVNPEYRDIVIPHLKNEYCDQGEAISLEFKMTDRFGNEKWISHNCNPVFDEKGQFLGRRGNNIDITARKKDEQELLKLSTAVEQSSSAIIITDTEGLIQYVNPYFEKLTGYAPAEVIGQNPRLLKSGKTDPKTYVELWSSVTSGKIWQGEFINKKKTGEIFIENAIISPIKDEYGKIVNFVAIKQDITEKKEIDRQILQTIISTEERERTRFAQDLHDDLGPLLSTAKLYIRSFETAKDLKHREIAINQSIKTIDEAILSIKELSNNISPHVLRNFGLTSGINSLVNKINETKTIKISFTSGLSERLGESAESSIFRIVSELVNNTIKHANATRAYIEINKNENDFILTYSDNGIGFKIEPALKKKMSRGLTNILNRVNLLGGEADLDSAPNKGFNVFIRLPFSGLLAQHDH
jgi:PAS domain S-box-containing protein